MIGGTECCQRCKDAAADRARRAGASFATVMVIKSGTMTVCPDCGNKRCPKATDHRLACTDSNEPGQPGSRY